MPREELANPMDLRGVLLVDVEEVLEAGGGKWVFALHLRGERHQALHGEEEVG